MRETKIERVARLLNRLAELGFSFGEVKSLQRIERTLQRWAELECGNDRRCIERDETTGKPHWLNAYTGRRSPIAMPDREGAALKRLSKIMAKHPELWSYHQGDCRGCMLYVGRKSDLQPGDNLDSVYTRGVAVCA